MSKKKKKIEESGFAEPGFFLIWGCTCKLTCPISHHGSLEASLMFLLCCEEYQTRQEDKHLSHSLISNVFCSRWSLNFDLT